MNRKKIVFVNSRHKSIFLLPNILTTIALCFGFLSIVASINADYLVTMKYLFFALVADGLDGRVARLTNTQSEFGKQYDSLSDLVSFGLSPAIMLIMVTSNYLHQFSWGVAFCYLALTAMRLARFNIQAMCSDFQGLPCPSAAVFLVMTTYGLHAYLHYELAILINVLFFLVALLMISTFIYPSFKNINFSFNQASKFWLVGVVFLCSIILVKPFATIWLLLLVFIVYGPFRFIYKYCVQKFNND